MLPSELPDLPPDKIVTLDTETTGLYPDDGAKVAVVSVSWDGGKHAYAWPFNQGLYDKPEWFTAYFGEEKFDQPIVDESGQPVLFKSGSRKGEQKTKRITHRYKAEEVMEPNPNLNGWEWEALCQWLSRYSLNGHNVLFDVVMMGTDVKCFSALGKPTTVPGVDLLDNVVWDSMLGNRIVYPQHPLGLEDSAHRLFGGGKTEEQEAIQAHLKSRRLPFGKGSWHLADWEVMEPYAKGDPVLTAKLGRLQWQQFIERGIPFERMHDEIDKLKTLVRMERKGLPYDAQTSLVWAEKLEARAVEIAQELPFEPTPNGARQFFFTKERTVKAGVACLGLKPEKMTAGGEKTPPVPTVDAETVALLVEKGAPQARKFQEYRLTADAASRYYRGYAEFTGPDGKVRTRFRQTGTATLRLSCERINLQAIPHDHRLLVSDSEILKLAPSPRALVHAIPGYRLWHADLEQAELRVATQFAPCPSMWSIIEAGLDPHGETAIALNLAKGPDDPGWFKARSVVGKRANFSLIFGIGPKKFKEDLGKNGLYLPLNKVTEIRNDWHGLYPEFKHAIDLHMDLAQKDGWTRVRGEIKKWYTAREKLLHDWHKAFNNRVQGNIGLFTGHWMVEADEYLMEQDLDPAAGLMLQIHDALVLMVPDNSDGEQMAEHVAQIGRDMWKDWFTIPGGVELKPWVSEGK